MKMRLAILSEGRFAIRTFIFCQFTSGVSQNEVKSVKSANQFNCRCFLTDQQLLGYKYLEFGESPLTSPP